MLVAALGTAEVTLNMKPGSLGNELSGGAGSADIMVAENTAICDTELNHQFFFGVMCDECNIHSCSLLS